MNSQTQKILELLNGGDWVCTSQMYALFMADPRRRLCDLRDKGYVLEKERCKLHSYHKGGSKMWKLVSSPSFPLKLARSEELAPKTTHNTFKINHGAVLAQSPLFTLNSLPRDI